MKFYKKFAVITLTFILSFSTGESQWQTVPSGSTAVLHSVEMSYAPVIYVSGINTILKSTNNGVNWSTLSNPVSGSFFKIQFVNETTGFICGLNIFYKTTNGGLNWTQLSGFSFRDFYFPTENSGHLLTTTQPPAYYRTTNGGLNFTVTQFTAFPDYIGREYSAFNFLNMYFIAYRGTSPDSTAIFKTTNTGVNWVHVSTIPKTFNSISFASATTGIICGNNTGILRTTNSGLNWSPVGNYLTYNLITAKFINSQTGYISGTNNVNSGVVLKTTNAGVNWLQQTISALNLSLNDVSINSSDSLGFIVGSGGNIFRTTNGGNITGVNQISNEVPQSFMLEQNYPNPFNPSTNIRFSVPRTGVVKLTIYDALGRNIAVLINENLSAGEYETTFDAAGLSSGIYLYRIETASFTETKKMILIK